MMRKTILLTSLLACATLQADDVNYRHIQSHQLMGGLLVGDMIYGTATLVDQFKTPGGKVYVQPEDYKLTHFSMPAAGTFPLDATFGAIQGKINCSFDGSGIRGFTQRQVNHGIDCTWKSGAGSDAEVKDFQLFLIESGLSDAEKNHPYYRDYHIAAKTLKGNLVVDDYLDVPVSLDLDAAEYRSGNNHTVYIRGAEYIDEETNEKQKVTFSHKVDTDADGKADYRIKLLGCSNEIRSAGGVDIFVSGGAPKAECEFAIAKRVKGAGWQYSPLTHYVALK